MSQLSQHRANLHKLNEAGAHLTSEESAQTASFFAEHRASGAHEESKSSRRLSIYGTTGVVDTAETRALRRAVSHGFNPTLPTTTKTATTTTAKALS